MDDKNKEDSYTFLSWDIDTTGRRLIDEMCHLATYAPCCSFKQYIMPFRDIDYNSRKRHLLKTVNIGVYRVLRETAGGKILKTKSEVSALTDFIIWLEQRKLLENKGIILMYYESFTPAPFILIESLKKYELLGRFKESVQGFANCYHFIKAKCEKSMQTYSIKTLAKMLLNKEYDKPHDAFERARILYEIVDHLSVGESQDGLEDLAAGLENHVSTIEEVETAIAEMKLTLRKQNSLKPIFGPIIRFDKKRRHAIILRRHLTDADIGYETLKSIWLRNEDVGVFLKNNLRNTVTDQDLSELVNVISKHFGGSGIGVGSELNSQSDKSRAGSAGGGGKASLDKDSSPTKSVKRKVKSNKLIGDFPTESPKVTTVPTVTPISTPNTPRTEVESKSESPSQVRNDDPEVATTLSEADSDNIRTSSIESSQHS